MIMTVEFLRSRVSCGNTSPDILAYNLESIEAVIRKYTNNNFQNRAIRFVGNSEGKKLYGYTRRFRKGDTVQVTRSELNDGLYVVTEATNEWIKLNKNLHEIEYNLVTKIEYPPDVIQCAIDLFVWKQTNGNKVGIKSETLSRHSVTYEDSTTLFMGYPIGILNGLSLHRKARC